MKQLAQGRQDFKGIIEEELLYVDRTKEIDDLLKTKSKYLFFSRPRRFGKSLLISTLKYFFEGEKELFKGLYIYDKYDFEAHPVIHLDFSRDVASFNEEVLRENLEIALKVEAEKHGVKILGTSLTTQFSSLIKHTYQKTGKQVVVLVDEYDKPISDRLTDTAAAEANRDILRELFAGIKGADQYLQLFFLTGVSRFAKVSIFFTLNNIADITLNPQFHNLVGFKPEDILHYFEDYVIMMAEEYEISPERMVQEIQRMYNGYSWDGKQKLYNPYSLTAAFFNKRLENYWFQSGTPLFLIQLIRQRQIFIPDMDSYKATPIFDSSDSLANLDLTALLFQTGYLTVDKVEKPIELGESELYHLKYPNNEVKRSMFNYLLADNMGLYTSEVPPKYIELKKALRSKDMKIFLNFLKATFAKIPAKLHLKAEAYYHSLFYMLLELLGTDLRLEEEQAIGTVDAVLETPNYVYIIEFKYSENENMDSVLEKAMRQIRERKYYEPYISEQREVLLLAVGFFGKEEIGLKLEPLTQA